MCDTNNRIYETVNSRELPVWNTPSGSKLSRSKTIAPSSLRAHNGYAVPRSFQPPTPPPPRPIAGPAVPPRNRHTSEGTDAPTALSCSAPSDRSSHTLPSRSRTTSTPSATNHNTLAKSPSVLSVSSAQSGGVEELALSEFMQKYSKSLPLRVKVCKGFYGVSDQTAVTTGDIFNFHFMKSTKVVVLETSDGTLLSIPFNSSILFSVLYNPNDNLKEAKKGFHFETVSDLLAMKSLPKVVLATKAHQGSSPESSVSEGELLVIRSSKSKLTGKQLKVFSLTTSRKKSLSENCAGHFSTSPQDVKMHLYEITMHIQDVFGSGALLTLPEECADTILSDLAGAIVTLKQSVTESSVIANSAVGEDGELNEVAEMPFELDIEVEAIALDDQEIEQLRQDTRYMYEMFDPFCVCLYMMKPTKRLYDIQCQLYRTVMMGSELRGLEILRPTNISPNQPAKNQSQTYQPLNVASREKLCTDYYVVMTPRDQSFSAEQTESSDMSGESHTSNHLSYLEGHIQRMEEQLEELCEELQRQKASTDHLRKFCESLQTQIRIMGAEQSAIDSRPCAPLPGQLKEPSQGSHSPSPLPEGALPKQSKKDELTSLSRMQVLKLLEMMGLKTYTDKFRDEHVNGEILSECDEEVLCSDLGISSKLHRMRLMKVISGRHSAKSILAGEDPYAHPTQQS